MRRPHRERITAAWLAVGCVLATPWAVSAADPAADLGRPQHAIDQAATAQGQERVAGRLADQLNASWGQTPAPYSAESLAIQRAQSREGWGALLIANLLAQEIARQNLKANPTLTPAQALAQATAQVMASRQAGTGWGVIAQNAGVKLGMLVSSVQRSAAAVTAGAKGAGASTAAKGTGKAMSESGVRASDRATEQAAGIGRGLTGFAAEGQPPGGAAVAGTGAGSGSGQGADHGGGAGKGGADRGGADHDGGGGPGGGGGGGKGK